MKKSFSKLREDINIPALGLTYDREIMPQITDPKAFIEHLRSQSIPFDNRKIDSNTLKATQMNFDMNKVQGLLGSKDVGPVFVSKDNHIMDGHHRWLANYYSGRPTNCCVVDLPILELMRIAKEHTGSLNENLTHKDFKPMMDGFVKYVSDDLGIKNIPSIRFKDVNDDFASFGGYNPSDKSIVIDTKNRHPMDIFRTLAHELVHAKQDEDGRIKDVSKEGETGSEVENEANAKAGIHMRNFGRANPDMFKQSSLVEDKSAIFVVGVPCSGKDSVIRNLQESLMEVNYYQEIDIQTLEKKRQLAENIIVSASANNYDSIVRAKSHLENLGYMTEMIFVDVSNQISKLRNEQREARGQRVIKESIRFSKYTESKNNLEKFTNLFEDNISIIKNDNKLTEACWKGYYQPKDNKLKPKKGSPGQFVPNCVPKKKSVKEETNVRPEEQNTDIDLQFAKFVENTAELNTYKREEGTKALADLYKKGTPGQWYEEDCGCEKTKTEEKVVADDIGGPTTLRNPLSEKKKIIRKKRIEEDGVLDTASGAVGLPVSDSIGAEFGVAKSPSLIGGLVGVSSPISGFGPAGSLYPFGTYGIAESVSNWANKPETIERYRKKYGKLAEQKLLETVKVISESIEETEQMPKTIRQIRESWEGRAGRDMGTVPYSHAEDKVNEASPAWQRKEGKNPEGGLNRKGVESYRRENPGSKLQTAVTTDPSKLKPGSKKAKRRLSFCRRMKGMKAKLTSAKTARDPDSRINKSLRKWNCE